MNSSLSHFKCTQAYYSLSPSLSRSLSLSYPTSSRSCYLARRALLWLPPPSTLKRQCKFLGCIRDFQVSSDAILSSPAKKVRVSKLIVFCVSKEWTGEKSPYEILGLERGCTIDEIKSAYRSLAKTYHPDVYNGKEELEDGETPELRFIRIQAAYELLMDPEERQNYDRNNLVNPMKASRAWAEWVMKKKKAYEQRGDMAVSAWAAEQQRNMNLKARALSRAKVDPEEERRLLAKERQASMAMLESTLKRHNLVLRKRDIMQKKAEEASKQRLARDLLLAEGFEIDEN